MRLLYTSIILFSFFCSWAQGGDTLIQNKKVAIGENIILEKVSINPYFFQVINSKNEVVQDSFYSINYNKANLSFKSNYNGLDSVTIKYLKYPEFITRTYRKLDSSVIVKSNGSMQRLVKLSEQNFRSEFKPFDGLNSSGSLSRGVTVGNNQNSVLKSELDLQISGKINDKVTLRASVQDANTPLQQSGYSQRLDEFDQIFIEAFSDQWSVRAGDIDLENKNSYFAKFSKRVQGLLLISKFKNSVYEANAFVSGALVRGQFVRSQFTAQEGNQGPYKLKGPNNELFVLVVSGSEIVYVNGIALERGATNDYVIDYNAGEIIFNPTFPINSEMRIIVDYQYSERNYTRFVGYAGGQYKSSKLKLGVSIYNENDLKNQSLQQNLSNDQISILSQAGDDKSNMISQSATPQEFSENRILYKKELLNGQEVFVFSNDPNDELFQVNFLSVGDQQGDYIISNLNSVTNIYEYVPPVMGQKQGNYSPIIQLVAPEKLQIAIINGSYQPSDKTNLEFEFAASRKDLNLFSNISDSDNDGLAFRYKFNRAAFSINDKWALNMSSNLDYIQSDFRNIERLYNPEFNRDWNLKLPVVNGMVADMGNQLLNTNTLNLSNSDIAEFNYSFQHLNFSRNFNGNRHNLTASVIKNKLELLSKSSILKTNGDQIKSEFFSSSSQIKFRSKIFWPGIKINTENNEVISRTSNQLDSLLSQRFFSYEGYVGIGDSTNIFLKLGYINRINDSVQDNKLKRVNRSNNYYINSKLINSKQSDLSLFINYRLFKSQRQNESIQKSLNSRVFYSQRFANNLIQWQTVYETNSGQLPQQEFTYVQVEPGQGSYIWFDYNDNGIQELEEFEIAQFQDQATYIRVLLPNQIFIRTHQNRLSQSLILDAIRWNNSLNNTKRFLSHFYNLSTYIIDRKDRNDIKKINLNPFRSYEGQELGLQSNFRNQLFFNRGKQHYTISYSYSDTELRNVLSFGSVGQKSRGHQFNLTHKIKNQWLLNMQTNFEKNSSTSDNFSSKNFVLDLFLVNPKLSYLLDDNKRFDLYYQYFDKENLIQNFESLEQHKWGISAVFTQNQKAAFTFEANYFSNNFNGNINTPVAYQMMEGLQPGSNFTWSIVAQKRLTKYLDLNLNYFGRKSDLARAVHTGTVQLKAYF